MHARSFVTNLVDGARISAGPLRSRGIAFDGGSSWSYATLEAGNGPYAFRPWQAYCNIVPGKHCIEVRATANDGSVQPLRAAWNPGGHAYNAVETYRITAT